uniref:LEM domain-containing protein n=1 Tax=Glossina austeni TaxID=7395 RepID=A0A1A9VC28_GLOAU
MDKKTNYLSLILLDALEDANESDIFYILERNENIDPAYVPQDHGIAPLHYVCGMENEQLAIKVAKRFLEMGANPNVRSEDNMTPLHIAAIHGREEIVKLLLQYDADLEIYDVDRKTPLLYAIEECHFEVVQLMRDHIFLKKYEKKKNMTNILQHSVSSVEKSLQPPATANSPATCTLQRNNSDPATEDNYVNKALQKLKISQDNSSSVNEKEKFTPNRLHYNYDVTSPYYINITHRRHKPQPKFPELIQQEQYIIPRQDTADDLSASRISGSYSDRFNTQSVNIFTLTEENLKELTQSNSNAERSRLSIIDIWRQKVQKSRARKSIIKQFDNVSNMIDEVMDNEHYNFTNIAVREKCFEQPDTKIESDARNTSPRLLGDEAELLETREKAIILNSQDSLSKVFENVVKAKILNFEDDLLNQNSPLDSSYHTASEVIINTEDDTDHENDQSTRKEQAASFVYSPRNKEYFLQMTEAYVHTDDENGLVFYETKLLSNLANKMAEQCLQVNNGLPNQSQDSKVNDLDSTGSTRLTNFAVPLDYETDDLRAELTTFGAPPGPITKSTKRLYIKKLIKYKRNTTAVKALKKKLDNNILKFSVELQRTLKSVEQFERIQKEYTKYEVKSVEYFANNKVNHKKARGGHLKQSFIYMLIDPRISCNLPGEIMYLEKYDMWQRFLQSIFYVGKAKTSRPYSHLYEAMKVHSRLHQKELQEKFAKKDKNISTKKQLINMESLKVPSKKSTNSKKLNRILEIWANGNGVVCLHVFHNIVPIEAYTREAAIIEALGLQHLTNCKRGDYYGPAKTWTMKEKKYLGIALLHKAMLIYLAEGESQLSPSDLI